MKKDDVKLIRSTLSGDDTAFSELVYKYQKSVHALAWRKIGDFQIAEEIAQDTFLQAYKKLATLRNPSQFAGWLYVIAANLCTDWKRKKRKKPIMKSLEVDRTHAINGILTSDDNGETWTSIAVDTEDDSHLRFREPILTIADNTLYAIAGNYSNNPRICRLPDGGDKLLPIHEIPEFQNVSDKGIDKKNTETANNDKESSDLQVKLQNLMAALNLHEISSMAITGKTFYVVYDSRLLKWKPEFSQWIDTGLDTGAEEDPHGIILAAYGNTVYFGRQDGRLFQSLDEGGKWTDITKKLPIQIEDFDDITFADSGVFIATDKGVLTSHTGKQWRVIEGGNGKNIKIRRLTVDRSEVYGVHHSGIYRYSDDGKWELISPELPDFTSHLVVHNDKFFIATFQLGIFKIPVRR